MPFMKVPTILPYGIALIVIFSACSDKDKRERQVIILGDTLKVIINRVGDTVLREYIRIDEKQEENYSDTSIYSSKDVDTAIPQLNFYFLYQGFRIYFRKELVIAYCDSVIRNTPDDRPGAGHVNWHIVNSAKRLKDQVQSGKPMREELAGWLAMLLERFRPLIIDSRADRKSKILLREKFLSKTWRYRKYSSVSQKGDTSFIALEQDFLVLEIQE